MANQVQESLMTADESEKPASRLVLVRLVVVLLLVAIMAAFGIFTATHANGEDIVKEAPTQAKVLPDLNIAPESLEPNLGGMLATGDGGALLFEGATGSVSRNTTKRDR